LVLNIHDEKHGERFPICREQKALAVGNDFKYYIIINTIHKKNAISQNNFFKQVQLLLTIIFATLIACNNSHNDTAKETTVDSK
jgi:hypothetical protein